MSEQIDIFKCLDYIRDHAQEYAQAKANRMHLEQYRKTCKSTLMIHSDEKTAVAKEAWAYAHPEYRKLLESYKAAIEEEEKLKYLMICAQAKIEVFRTIQANNRFIDKVHT